MCVIDTTEPTTSGPAAAPDVTAPPQGPLAVDLQGITKRFPGVVANSDLHLQVERGTIHAIVGENGAGKSTLMKILYGVQKPDEGIAKIAAATGGGYFELTSPGDVIGKFDRVIEELHHQYALGFVPQKFDGKVHELTVKVTRPGHAVRARKHYLAPRR